MKKIMLIAFYCISFTALFAQKPITAQPVVAVVKPVPPIVSTKELKKQLESNFKRKKYKNVIPIADTLLTRLKKDENIFMKKISSEIYLKMDKQAIADLKKWYKNKDTAATIISYMPYQFDFVGKKRSGDIYYKSAMSWAPKNGMPYILYGAQLADAQKPDEALTYARKGYNLMPLKYKTAFASTYSYVLHLAGEKDEAYKLMEDELLAGRNSNDNIRDYFTLFIKDKKYKEGIDKASEFISKDSLAMYFAERAELNFAAGSGEMACEDAVILKEKFSEYDYFLKKYNCAQVMADVAPTMQRTYIYQVIFQGKTYDFRVTNPKVNMDEGISFKYKMTGDVGINGTVNISKDAINTAHGQMNHFGKNNYDLTDRTTVWISNEVFNEIKNKGESIINGDVFMGQGEVVFTDVTDQKNIDELYYKVTVDDQDKYIKAIKILGKDGEEMWINDDPKNPLILKMKTDFTIELLQIL
jgi:hypothetical protein